MVHRYIVSVYVSTFLNSCTERLGRRETWEIAEQISVRLLYKSIFLLSCIHKDCIHSVRVCIKIKFGMYTLRSSDAEIKKSRKLLNLAMNPIAGDVAEGIVQVLMLSAMSCYSNDVEKHPRKPTC